MPTPRAVKRFSNVYRILKAPVPADRLRSFEGTGELLGEFQVPMLLLAMLIGAPVEAVTIFPELQKRAMTSADVTGVLENLTGLAAETGNLGALQDKIRPIVTEAQFPRAPELFNHWIPRVARFSFDVGRAVEMSRYAPEKRAGERRPEQV
jgi:hypothetical protein